MNLFPDIPVALLARSSTCGPLDLAEDLKRAGMLAAAWQVEDLQQAEADARTDGETAGNNFDEAVSRAAKLVEDIDELDGELLASVNEAEDAIEGLEPTVDELRAILRALIKHVETDRERLQGLAIDARGIADIDTDKEARELAAKEAKRQADKAAAERKYQAEVSRANVATGQRIRAEAKKRRAAKAKAA